jgi:hypothetical protein
LLTRLLISKPPAALVRKFKAHDKITKRGLTGAKSAEKERQIAKTIKTKKKKDDAATIKKTEKATIVAKKAIVAAAKIAENVRVKKAQKAAKID